jgi:hypothetical protein
MHDAKLALGLDLARSPGALDASGLEQRAAVAIAAARRAETLAGAALERVSTLAPARRQDPEAAGSLADGCAPTLTGCAAVHAGLAPTELASARISARIARELPALAEARRTGRVTESVYRALRHVADPSTVTDWLAAAATLPAGALHRKLAAALPGDRA